MSMGILDFSTQSTSSTENYTTTQTDSFNRSTSSNSVMDNVGNVTYQLSDKNAALNQWLPILAVVAVVAAILFSRNK
jgi:hypothetical protein